MADINVDELLRRAREGDENPLGRLLESYRHYLDLLTRLEIGDCCRPKSIPRTSCRNHFWKLIAIS